MKQTIHESSGAIEITSKLSRPDAGSLVTRPGLMDWNTDSSSGFSYKPLFEDPQSGQKTVLMKVDAGCVAPPHVHDKLEQIFVLEGEFYDEYLSYVPGDFIVRAPGALHTGGSHSGALVLLVYSS